MFNEKTQMYDGIIYCFTNKINNKKYVGQTQQTLKQRISNHLSKTNKKYYFQNALLKYGIDNFNIEILESISADTKNNLKLRLNNREKFYILKYKTTDHNYGYNLTALLKGIYSGFVDASKIDKNELNFMREISLKN